MKIYTLIISVIKNGNTILLRKKPDGSPPYKETWYLFGAEITGEQPPEEVITEAIKKQTGINTNVNERLGWDAEIKPDHQGELSYYIYLDCLCTYISGELTPGPGIEKLEWVPLDKLMEYDLVPPTKKLLTKLGYL